MTQEHILVSVLLSVLATYRLSSDIADELGIFNIYAHLRTIVTQIGQKYNLLWLAQGIHCSVCVSFWVSFVFALVVGFAYSLNAVLFILIWFAIAGGTKVLVRVLK